MSWFLESIRKVETVGSTSQMVSSIRECGRKTADERELRCKLRTPTSWVGRIKAQLLLYVIFTQSGQYLTRSDYKKVLLGRLGAISRGERGRPFKWLSVRREDETKVRRVVWSYSRVCQGSAMPVEFSGNGKLRFSSKVQYKSPQRNSEIMSQPKSYPHQQSEKD